MRFQRELEELSALQAPTRRDSGFTLTEVLVTITLMGIAIIPIMLAGIVSIRASATSRSSARVETVLVNAADRVNRASEGCSYDVYVQAAALAEGWNSDRATASYEYYVPGSSPTTIGTWTSGACPNGVRPDGLVQKVTISVTSPDDRIHRTIVMVKSDV